MALPTNMPTRDPNRQTDRSDTYDGKRGGYYPQAKPAEPKPPTKP